MNKLSSFLIVCCVLLLAGCGHKKETLVAKPSYEAVKSHALRFLNEGKLKEAFLTSSAAIKLDDKKWEGYLLAGLSLEGVGANKEAADFVRQAFDRAPESKKPALQAMLKRLNSDEATKQKTKPPGKFQAEASQVEKDLDK